MKHPITHLALALVLGILVFAWLYRYDMLNNSGARFDRWTGCVQPFNKSERKFDRKSAVC